MSGELWDDLTAQLKLAAQRYDELTASGVESPERDFLERLMRRDDRADAITLMAAVDTFTEMLGLVRGVEEKGARLPLHDALYRDGGVVSTDNNGNLVLARLDAPCHVLWADKDGA